MTGLPVHHRLPELAQTSVEVVFRVHYTQLIDDVFEFENILTNFLARCVHFWYRILEISNCISAGPVCLVMTTLWTLACQSPLFMGFSRYEYWSLLPFPSPADLPDSRTEPAPPVSPALHVDSLPAELWGMWIHLSACSSIRFLPHIFWCSVVGHWTH